MGPLASTVTLAEAAPTPWDVIVVGAGPAGALAARQAARRGLRTLLVERRRLPRDKVCGGCLNERAVSVLRLAGLDGRTLDAGALPTRSFQLHSGRRRFETPLPGGLALSRRTFDALLAAAAVESGAALLQETTAEVGPLVDAGRRVTLRAADGPRAELTARVVVSADGLGHSSLRGGAPWAASQVARGARLGLGAVLEGAGSAVPAGVIRMAVGRGGYVGLVRVEAGRLNVAAAVDEPWLRDRGGPAAATERLLTAAGFSTVAGWHEADWHGTLPLTRQTPRRAAERLLLLGDATGYVEPFTGEGMAWALAAAWEAAPLVERAARAWRPELTGQWESLHARVVSRRQAWCRLLAAGLRRPWVVEAALAAAALAPGWTAPLVRHLNAPLRPIE